MSEVIVIGTDEHGLTDRLVDAGVDAHHLEGRPIGADLTDAGIEEAGALVVTEASLASAIAVAKEQNPHLTVVLYSRGRLPPYASRQADLAVDPQLVAPAEVADAVVDRLAGAS